jgi:adenylate kinase
VILLMGIPGSGKGTQGALFAKEHSLQVISTGELLRNYGSEEQHARMASGAILADEEVTDLLDKALHEVTDKNAVILDGYPRRISQVDWLLGQSAKGHFKLDKVVHLVVSRKAVKARLLERGRQDDNSESIEARFKEYERETEPILEYLQAAGIEVVEIDGDKPVDVVHKAIMTSLK